MGDFHRIISSIKNNIIKDLPGINAHNLMAPKFIDALGFNSIPDKNTKESAVFIAIYNDNGIAKTILIKRSIYNGAHSGQVSFPGGKKEESDIDLIQTAIRETLEEIGLKIYKKNVIGLLSPLYIPVSNIKVLPVVGVVTQPENLHLNLREVEYTIPIELNEFKKIENISEKPIIIKSMPISMPFYSIDNEIIWGATAMIISELTELY